MNIKFIFLLFLSFNLAVPLGLVPFNEVEAQEFTNSTGTYFDFNNGTVNHLTFANGTSVPQIVIPDPATPPDFAQLSETPYSVSYDLVQFPDQALNIIDNGNTITIENKGISSVYNKDTCSLSLFNPNEIESEFAKESWTVESATWGSDNWNGLPVNSEGCETGFTNTQHTATINAVRQNDDGIFRVQYSFDLYSIKTTVYYTNYNEDTFGGINNDGSIWYGNPTKFGFVNSFSDMQTDVPDLQDGFTQSVTDFVINEQYDIEYKFLDSKRLLWGIDNNVDNIYIDFKKVSKPTQYGQSQVIDPHLTAHPSSPTSLDSTQTEVLKIDLDWDAGSTSTLDTTYDGTNNGATTGVTGKINNAWDFDGSAYVQLGSLIQGTGAYSFSFWFYNDDDSGNQNVFSAGEGWSLGLYQPSSDKLLVGKPYMTGATDINENEWYHVAYTRDSSGNQISYLNGVSDGTDSSSAHDMLSSYAWRIGASNYSPENWKGMIDELTVWSDRELSLSDVEALCNDSSGCQGIEYTDSSFPHKDDVIAHYDFEQTGSTLENQATVDIAEATGYRIYEHTAVDDHCYDEATIHNGSVNGDIYASTVGSWDNYFRMDQTYSLSGFPIWEFKFDHPNYTLAGLTNNAFPPTSDMSSGTAFNSWQTPSFPYIVYSNTGDLYIYDYAGGGGATNISTSITGSDTLKFELDSTSARFYVNDVLKHTFSTTPSGDDWYAMGQTEASSYSITNLSCHGDINTVLVSDTGDTDTEYQVTQTWVTETQSPTPDLEEDFTPQNTWTDNGSTSGQDVSSGTLNWVTTRDSTWSNHISHDLGSTVSDTAWVLRFNLTIDSDYSNAMDAYGFGSGFALTEVPTGTNNNVDGYDWIGIQMLTGSSGYYNSAYWTHQGDEDKQYENYNSQFSETISADDEFWVEIIRNSETEVITTFYSDSSYETVVESKTDTISGIENLRYLRAWTSGDDNSGSSVLNWKIDDIEFYDGVTSGDDINTVLVSDTGDTDTDYQVTQDSDSAALVVGTEYTFKVSALNEISPDINETFDSDTGWTLNSASVTGGEFVSTGSGHSYKGYTIGEPDKILWDWEWNISEDDTPFIQLTSDTSGYGNAPSGEKKIIIWISPNGNMYIGLRVHDGSSQQEGQHDTGAFAGSFGTNYYYRYIHDTTANTWSLAYYTSDADRSAGTNAVDSASESNCGGCSNNHSNGNGIPPAYTTANDFAYVGIGDDVGHSGNDVVDNIQIYLGTTNAGTVESDLSDSTSWEIIDDLAQPTGLSAVSGLPIELDWDDVSNAVTYNIYRDTFTTPYANTGSSTSAYTDSSASSGVTYEYKVAALGPSPANLLVGPLSSGVSGTGGVSPDPPTSLTATITDSTNSPFDVDLSFTTPGDLGTGTLSGYEIVRDSVVVHTTSGSGTTYTDTVSSPGTYVYTVRTVTDHGTSSDSNSDSVSTPSIPSAISDLAATVISDVQIDLAWTQPSSDNTITNYYIFRDSVNIQNTTSTSYQNTGLTSNTEYYFNVFGVSNVGTGSVSNTETKTTYTTVSGSISTVEYLSGVALLIDPTLSISGTPTPNFTEIKVYDDGVYHSTQAMGNSDCGSITDCVIYHFTDDVQHSITITATDTEHWDSPTITSSAILSTPEYSPSWDINNVAYNVTRNTNDLELIVNRDIPVGWDLTCEYQTTSEAMAKTTGIQGVMTDGWYFENEGSSAIAIGEGDHVYITCRDGDDTVLTFTSYGPNLIQGGIGLFDQHMGEFLGLESAAVLFVIFAASLFGGRSAPTGILVVLSLIGVLGFVGFMTISEATWGIIMLCGVCGLFIGKRFL